MGEVTKIQWADHTFNPWEGCQRVSAGCEHCYAEARNRRFGAGANFGPGAPRRMTSESNWRQPLAWHREAIASGLRRRVFCASLADVFDLDAPPDARVRLWLLIKATPGLDWLLLTKRPENLADLVPWPTFAPWPNVWLGTTVENRAAIPRIPTLVAVPAAKHFLSVEPLLEDIGAELERPETMQFCLCCSEYGIGPALGGEACAFCGDTRTRERTYVDAVDWIIVGGESGPGARTCELAWVRNVVRAGKSNGATKVFVKQLGAQPSYTDDPTEEHLLGLRDRKGGDPAEWPEDLRVREVPDWRGGAPRCEPEAFRARGVEL